MANINPDKDKGKISAQQRQKLKHFVKELSVFRGRHTEFVSVYVPQGYDMNAIINHLQQEQGTATNIKSKTNRDAVITSLERMIQHLKLIKRTPSNGLAAFAGNIAKREGFQEYKVWSIEPPSPINLRLYRCDKEFIVEPLKEMADDKAVYGLVVMDRRDASIALLKGKTIIPLAKEDSMVPGKFKAGGQCLTPDTLVYLSDGNIVPIKDLKHDSVKSASLNEYVIRDSTVIDNWCVKKNMIYEIITKEPQIIIHSSKDHIFYVHTPTGIIEKPADKLVKTDVLIMPETINVPGRVYTINSKKYHNSFIITQSGRNILKIWRAKKGLLQKQLALTTGVTQTTVSSYEIGKLNIEPKNLQHLCSSLGINFDEFLEEHTIPSFYKDIKLPTELNADLSQFLGYLQGDGTIEEDRITFFEQDKQVVVYYQEKYNTFFKTTSNHKFREDKNYYQLRFTSRPLVRLVVNEFPLLKNGLNSLIPAQVLTSPNDVLAGFLRGLFDAEGYIHKNRGVGLGINNKYLARQVQLSLLRFSILASISVYDNRKNPWSKKPRYTIDITEGQSLKYFKEKIGLSSERKISVLENLIKHKSNSSRVRQIIISGTVIRKIIAESGYNLQLFPKVNSFFRNERSMGKKTYKQSILGYTEDSALKDKLQKILDYSLLPVKISHINKYIQETEMIDISVDNQNFIANGLIVHNSAMRFAQNRELAAKDFYKKIGDMMKDQFLMMDGLKGILVGGPGPTKYEFVDGNFITTEVKNKIIGIKDLSYTEEFGLQELVEKSDDILADEEIAEEKKIMQKFFDMLGKQPGKTAYGKDEVLAKLRMGAVDMVLLSESLDDDVIDLYTDEAEKMNSNVFIVSVETREGVQLKEMGKIVAMLRYEIRTE